MLTEGEEQVISKITNDLKKQGIEFQDKNAQIAFLDNLIDADFNLNDLNADEIAQQVNSGTIQEGGHGGALGTAHVVLDNAVENPELIEKILHFIYEKFHVKIDSKKVISAIKKVIKVLGFIPNLFQKGIYKLLKLFGLSVEGAKIGSLVGISLFIVVCIVVAAVFLPEAIMAAGTIAGAGLLLFKLTKLAVTIKTLWKAIKTAKTEHKDEIFTSNDFLDAIEKKMKSMDQNKYPLIKKDVGYDWVSKSEDWFNHLSEFDRNRATKMFERTINAINSGKGFEGHFKSLADLGFPFAKQINLMLTTTKENVESQKYYQGPMAEGYIRKIVREIFNELDED